MAYRKHKYNTITTVPGFIIDNEAEIIAYYGENVARELILNEKAEHIVFYHNVTELIDESVFDPLYNTPNGPGKPAYSPRVLLAFLIYCACTGITLVRMIESLVMDVRIRLAIGLLPQSDLFCYKTVYNFRRRLVEYEEITGIDLVEKCFSSITSKQLVKYGIDASQLRMDSKMFDSNIKAMSRYEIVLSTLQLVLKKHPFQFNPVLQKKIDSHLNENGEHTMYGLKNGRSTFQEIMTDLGNVVHEAMDELIAYEADKNKYSEIIESDYALLYRVFDEQYCFEGNKVVPKRGDEISPDSVQNPYDFEAAYLTKNGNEYRGYKINASETFGKNNPFNLVTAYQVVPATVADKDLYREAVLKSENTSGQKAKATSTDSAYTSDENREFNLNHFLDPNVQHPEGTAPVLEQWVGKMGGKMPQFNLIQEEAGSLKVTDRKTGKEYRAERTTDRVKRDGSHMERWKATIEKDGKLIERLFTIEDLEMANRRREIESMPKEKLSCRNNVEATMFQMGYTTDGCQTRVRGLYKHKLFIGTRILWMNFRRIFLFLGRKDKMKGEPALSVAL